MPPISHRVLYWSIMVTALAGQFMLSSYPKPAIILCGAALILALLDGWWYLAPISSNWWYPGLIGVIGLTMWSEPRGWFFMAWAAVIIGTGLRARAIHGRFTQAIEEERARVQRLKEMGFEPDSPFATEAPVEPVVVAPPPPIPVWRYPVAVGMGLLAAWVGAWCTRIAFDITHFQLDIVAYLIGYLVGKAVTAGAGDRSNRWLQAIAAVLSAGGVLYGRYLLLRVVFFDQLNIPYSTQLLVTVIRKYPGKTLGLWLVLFVALGAWTGWRYAIVHRPPSVSESRESA